MTATPTDFRCSGVATRGAVATFAPAASTRVAAVQDDLVPASPASLRAVRAVVRDHRGARAGVSC